MKRTMIKLDTKNQMKRIFSIFPRERERKKEEKKAHRSHTDSPPSPCPYT